MTFIQEMDLYKLTKKPVCHCVLYSKDLNLFNQNPHLVNIIPEKRRAHLIRRIRFFSRIHNNHSHGRSLGWNFIEVGCLGAVSEAIGIGLFVVKILTF
jgi:hypothetical protein